MRVVFGTLIGSLVGLTVACSSSADSTLDLRPITIQLGSTHQALYAGLYAADQNGIYADEGLSVTFVEGSPATDLVTPLLDGTAQFGAVGASTLIQERAEGQPIMAIATILRRDPVVFFSLAESGIVRLEDFVGKRVQVSARLRPRLHGMLGHAGIDSNDVIEVDTGDFTALYSGEIDVASGLVTTSVHAAEQAGYEVNRIYPDDYGVHFYSITVFTSDDLIASDPELVTRFLRATLEGWQYALENPQEIGAIVRDYNPNADADVETASMIAYLPYINTGEDEIGWMKTEIWEGMAAIMREQGELSAPLDVTDVYTTQFIEEIYGEANP
jgi:NitT/TauT family transport system substrate-binding protein